MEGERSPPPTRRSTGTRSGSVASPTTLTATSGRSHPQGPMNDRPESCRRIVGISCPGMTVALRPIGEADLDQLFEWERDPDAVAMAAFTRADPSDRAAFDRHYQQIRDNPDCLLRAIDDGGTFVGTIGSFSMDGEREVTYWIDPSRWGHGLGTRALKAFLEIEATRPLFARVAEHNVGSAKVLARVGFTQVGSEVSYADGVGREVIEDIYCLTTQRQSPAAGRLRGLVSETVGVDWVGTTIWWHCYVLGFVGAERRADERPQGPDGAVHHRLRRLLPYVDYLLEVGANGLLLGPVFASVSHGYDTLDHYRIDPRLGDHADVDDLVSAARERGVRVCVDGVFNHLSRDHEIVRRAEVGGPRSEAGRWLRWSGDYPYGFEGNLDLVELDLTHPPVADYVVDVMTHWLDRGADAWRLDAAFAAGAAAWRPIVERVKAAHPDCWIVAA